MVVWKRTKGTINLDEIRKIERELTVTFPDEYVSCVLNHNGGQPEPYLFNSKKRNEYVMKQVQCISIILIQA